MLKPKFNQKILFGDIETLHQEAKIWRPGEQVIRHGQLQRQQSKMFRIATISYKWYDESTVHTLTCNEDGSGTAEMIAKFDAEVKKADVFFGKNNERFDNKHINAQRLLYNLPGMPEWFFKSDDLEKQFRKYFSFPSQSLDYLSEMFGMGGKVKMDENDWFGIENLIELRQASKFISSRKTQNQYCLFHFGKTRNEVVREGKVAFDKMIFYNKKDVLDTEGLFIKAAPHVQFRFNAATNNQYGHPNACITCGSDETEMLKEKGSRKFKIRSQGQQLRVEFYCRNHKGYAGSRTFTRGTSGNIRCTGKMGK